MPTPDRDRATDRLSNPDSRSAVLYGAHSAPAPVDVPPRVAVASGADKTLSRRGWRTRRPKRLLSRVQFQPQFGVLEQRALLSVLLNGGFEQPTPLPNAWGREFSAGNTAIPGWSVVSGSVDIQSASWFDPYQGAQSLDLDGSQPGSIGQSFATTIGTTYQLSFAYGNNPDQRGTFDGPHTADVTVTDSHGMVLISSTVTHTGSTPTIMNYQMFTDNFVADTTITTLKFTSTDPSYSNNGIALDAVSVSPTPTPTPTPSPTPTPTPSPTPIPIPIPVGPIGGPAPTRTFLTAHPRPANLGRPVTLTATVKNRKHRGPTPIGSVTFLDGTANLGTVVLRRGKASLKTSSLHFGPNALRADYTPSQGFAPSGADLVENVRVPRSLKKAMPAVEIGRRAVPSTSLAIRVSGVAEIPVGAVTIVGGPTVLGPIGPDQGRAARRDGITAATRHIRTAPAVTDNDVPDRAVRPKQAANPSITAASKVAGSLGIERFP